jgi:hypothetical protein
MGEDVHVWPGEAPGITVAERKLPYEMQLTVHAPAKGGNIKQSAKTPPGAASRSRKVWARGSTPWCWEEQHGRVVERKRKPNIVERGKGEWKRLVERESEGSTVGEDAPRSRHSDRKTALPTPKKNLREEEDGDGFLDLTTVNEGEELILDIDFRAQDNEEEDGAVGQPAVAASSAADPVATSSNGLQHHSPQ